MHDVLEFLKSKIHFGIGSREVCVVSCAASARQDGVETGASFLTGFPKYLQRIVCKHVLFMRFTQGSLL